MFFVSDDLHRSSETSSNAAVLCLPFLTPLTQGKGTNKGTWCASDMHVMNVCGICVKL